MERFFCWLGHLGHMGDGRLPKQLLFGELQRKWQTNEQWCDEVLFNLKAINIDDCLCQDRMQWTKLFNSQV